MDKLDSWEWCQEGAVNITHLGGCVAGDYCLPVPNDEAALVLVHAEHLRFESFVEIRTNIYTHLLHQQSSHGCSQTCNRYEICGRLHSSSEELKRQAEFLSVILQVCPWPDFPPIKQLPYRTYHLPSRGKLDSWEKVGRKKPEIMFQFSIFLREILKSR